MGNIRDPKFLPPLIAAIGARDETVREVQARVISYYGDAALAALAAPFQSPDVYVHMGAAEALEELNYVGEYDAVEKSEPFVSGAAALLDKAIARQDLAAGAGAFGYYVRQGDRRAVAFLTEALDTYGGERMATTLLNCGDDTLQDAAKSWATAHGYTTGTTSGQTDYKWGKHS